MLRSIVSSDLHPENTCDSSLVTPAGNTKLFIRYAFLKAPAPITVTVSGRVIFSIVFNPWKASAPIEVTAPPNESDVQALASRKALSGITVTEEPILMLTAAHML